MTTISLTWNPSSDVGGSGLAGYRVYRDAVRIGTTTTPGYLDTTAASGKKYSYTVSAFDNAENESAQSTAFSITTSGGSLPSDTEAPTTPGKPTVEEIV